MTEVLCLNESAGSRAYSFGPGGPGDQTDQGPDARLVAGRSGDSAPSFDLLRSHDFLCQAATVGESAGGAPQLKSAEMEEDPLHRNPDVWMYRGRTIGMLRRYLRYALDTGRVPSLLGGQYFRSGVTSYGMVTFEDRVIFVYDMEICLGRLSELSRQLIARYILQEHTCEDTARLLHCNEKTIRRNIPVALDQVSEMLLGLGLLETMNSDEKKTCQDVEIDKLLASDWELGK